MNDLQDMLTEQDMPESTKALREAVALFGGNEAELKQQVMMLNMEVQQLKDKLDNGASSLDRMQDGCIVVECSEFVDLAKLVIINGGGSDPFNSNYPVRRLLNKIAVNCFGYDSWVDAYFSLTE